MKSKNALPCDVFFHFMHVNGVTDKCTMSRSWSVARTRVPLQSRYTTVVASSLDSECVFLHMLQTQISPFFLDFTAWDLLLCVYDALHSPPSQQHNHCPAVPATAGSQPGFENRFHMVSDARNRTRTRMSLGVHSVGNYSSQSSSLVVRVSVRSSHTRSLNCCTC